MNNILEILDNNIKNNDKNVVEISYVCGQKKCGIRSIRNTITDAMCQKCDKFLCSRHFYLIGHNCSK